MNDIALICTVNLGRGMDNDYRFYSNGTIQHFYDRNSFNLNVEEWLTADEINPQTKLLILEGCPEEHRELVRGILSV